MGVAMRAQHAKDDPNTWEAMKADYETATGERMPEDLRPEDLDPSRYRVKARREAGMMFSFFAVEMFAKILMMKGWRFLLSEPPTYFITSDYPVGIYEPGTEGTIYGPAMASPKTEVSFPVTSTVAFYAAGEMTGVAWSEAPERIVRQMNARTAMRASFLVAPKPAALGVNLTHESMR
jgi:hypothetical protein